MGNKVQENKKNTKRSGTQQSKNPSRKGGEDMSREAHRRQKSGGNGSKKY